MILCVIDATIKYTLQMRNKYINKHVLTEVYDLKNVFVNSNGTKVVQSRILKRQRDVMFSRKDLNQAIELYINNRKIF